MVVVYIFIYCRRNVIDPLSINNGVFRQLQGLIIPLVLWRQSSQDHRIKWI